MAVILMLFQNCSKVGFTQVPISSDQTNAVTSSVAPAVVASSSELKRKTVQISSQPNKVDFLLVIDNSGSMKEDALSLAQKLSSFFSSLNSAQIDWQMCLTTTNALSSGQSYSWLGANSGIILNSNSGDIRAIVLNSIQYLFDSTLNNGDERGIAQAYTHMMNGNNSSCYRDSSLFVPLFISDEDERSTGVTDYSYVSNNPELYNQSSGPIENIDKAEFYLSEFKNRFGVKKIQSHSIVIKSNDVACFQKQDYYSNVSYGKFYENLANLTGGTTTSICEADFSQNLNLISTNVISLSQNLQMDCDPTNSLNVLVLPQDSNVKYQILGRQVALTYPSNKAYTVTVTYTCK